jgi:hypothetical protein
VLEKATILPEAPPGAAPIPILFNPTTYSLDESNTVAEIGVPGLGSPILQFVRGGARVLSMELLFDTYEDQRDVREHTDRIYGLLGIERTTHAPPICVFRWGSGFSLRCILERVSGRFTLFFPDGRPARATLTVSFKEYVDVEQAIRGSPTESADHTKTRAVARGDTLGSIAGEEYGDPRLWRAIASANGIHNPRRLQPGRVLVVPPLVRKEPAL